jgi:hypothetical protein
MDRNDGAGRRRLGARRPIGEDAAIAVKEA